MPILSFLLVVCLLGGCAVIRPTDPYAPAGGVRQDVYGSVAEPTACRIPQNPITLAEAIAVALANNPETTAAGWDVAAAGARQAQAAGERLPSLGVVTGYTRSLDHQRVVAARREGEPGAFTRDLVTGELVLSMPLFAGGRLANSARAADRLRDAADHHLSRSRQALVFDVSNLFFDILAQERVIESLVFSRQALEAHLQRTAALIAARKAAEVDRLRTEVRLADVRQQLAREKGLMAVQYRLMANLLGLADHKARLALMGELAPEAGTAVPDFDQALAQAMQRREDYLAARAALEAQAHKVDAARAGHWPLISVKGAYGWRGAAGPTIGPGSEEGDVGHVWLALEMPLFTGGRVDAAVREQRAELAAARERLRLLELRIALEIQTALSDVEVSRERVAAVRLAGGLARESLRIEQEKYSLGRGTVLDVLDAQAALLDSETTYYRVLADHCTALARLKLAMGDL